MAERHTSVGQSAVPIRDQDFAGLQYMIVCSCGRVLISERGSDIHEVAKQAMEQFTRHLLPVG